ncbi:hypothetical protein N7508_005234 [Penicillium antarcticum]|uniref:uncharacterized protein n=1 Tax=Penicillium antarcticum TaxID=416450 RepID=UPI0023A5DAB3|nr:uncharacterized protein N7508_005234 [Penicillium antarcticum]KAJ5306219.1 hypothetical protein N7508_005234 [Penicillium antarcticum]
MGWLNDLFHRAPQTPEAKKEEKARKRRSKQHSQKVRQREKELNRRPGEKKFFWGSVAVDTTQNAIRKETRSP